MSDREKYPSELAERFQLRMPNGMRYQIRAFAEENGRSMNTEIVLRLEHSLSGWSGPSLPEAYVDRILHASPQRRMDFETRLSTLTTAMVEQYFPKADDVMLQMQNAFSALMEKMRFVDLKHQEELWNEFDRLMEKLHIKTLDSE